MGDGEQTADVRAARSLLDTETRTAH
jgi:hypothetical protein